jgi:hypothetical protein
MPPQHSVNGIIPPWKKLPLQGPLRAGPQGYGALSISGDSWEVRPTSSIPLLYENTTAIETPKTNADGSTFHISHGMADQAIKWLDNWKGFGMPLSFCTIHRERFMLPYRCLRNGGISTKDSSMRDGMCTGNNCWSVRKR